MSARTRLALLCLSCAARTCGDACLCLVAVLASTTAGPEQFSTSLVAIALFFTPFVLLARLNGSLSDAPSRRNLLIWSVGTLCAVAGFALASGPWMACVAVVGVAAALTSAARWAVLPAVARDSEIPLPRIVSWIELGAFVAVAGGLAYFPQLLAPGWPEDGSRLDWRAVALLLAVNGIALLAALPAAFPSDQHTPARPYGFFRDSWRIVRDGPACVALVALACFQALFVAAVVAIVSSHFRPRGEGIESALPVLLLAAGGAALGSGVAGLFGHPRRCLGLVPFGAIAWAILLWAMPTVGPLVFWLGFLGGLVSVPLRAAYLASLPADARGNGSALMNAAVSSVVGLLCGLLALLNWDVRVQLVFLASLGAVAAVVFGVLLFRPVLELILAGVFLPFYRIRAHGPGRHHIPTSGPLIVVCNHSAYLDPLWLGKVVPRSLTPMMTSIFYDRPFLRFVMRWIVGAIRVQASGFRREVPELADAVAALRQGKCLLLFPEARLRRNEETMLRNFGQGIWHILNELPDTPVVVCWLSGGWGSYASYKGGPPFRNKRMDVNRRIDIAIEEPQPIPPDVLADQRQTRTYLMRRCLGCRRYLGLAVPDEIDEDEAEE